MSRPLRLAFVVADMGPGGTERQIVELAEQSAWGLLPVGNPVVKGEALFQRIVEDAE